MDAARIFRGFLFISIQIFPVRLSAVGISTYAPKIIQAGPSTDDLIVFIVKGGGKLYDKPSKRHWPRHTRAKERTQNSPFVNVPTRLQTGQPAGRQTGHLFGRELALPVV